MKNYRRRFAVLSFSLIAAVLLAVFTAIGIYMANNARREVFSSMQQVLTPFDFAPAMPKENREQAGMPRDRQSITVVFYYPTRQEIEILSNHAGIEDSLLLQLAGRAAELPEKSGSLSGAGLLYTREDTRGMVKLAFLSSAYLQQTTLRLVRTLAAVYVLALLLFYLICHWLAGIAVKPMEEAMAREAQFVTDLSHDLKTPLTVILANADILRQDGTRTIAEQKNWIDSTAEAANTMLSMVNEMLTISQVENEQKTMEKTSVDFSSLAKKICLQMDSVAYEKGITLTEEIEQGIRIPAREDYLSRILSSLLENALKYEPRGGSVDISLKEERSHAVLTVHNPGTSIDAEDLPHLFERFYRADKSRTGHRGFGLGLAIAKEMAEAMGGHLTVQSTPELGTLFRLQM